jgi:hypothetical protein
VTDRNGERVKEKKPSKVWKTKRNGLDETSENFDNIRKRTQKESEFFQGIKAPGSIEKSNGL